MKYLLLRDITTGARVPLLFCAPLSHAAAASAYSHSHVVVSAGFAECLPSGTWRTFGRSHSLSLGPALADDLLITALYKGTLRAARAEEGVGARAPLGAWA